MQRFDGEANQTRIRIGTWEENGGICVGFEAVDRFSRFECQRVDLDREETRELLAWEEECSR